MCAAKLSEMAGRSLLGMDKVEDELVVTDPGGTCDKLRGKVESDPGRKKASRAERLLEIAAGNLLAGIVHADTLGSGLLFGLPFSRVECLILPAIGSFQVGSRLLRIITFPIGFLPVHEVHVCHGVVVI